MKAWIVRDNDGYLMLSVTKPVKHKAFWFGQDTVKLPKEEFEEIKSTDTEPTEVEILIKEKK